MNVTTTVGAFSCLILTRHFVSLPIVYSICYPLKPIDLSRPIVTTQSLKYGYARLRNFLCPFENSCVGLKIPVSVWENRSAGLRNHPTLLSSLLGTPYHDTLYHDTLYHDTLYHDTLYHDTLYHFSAVTGLVPDQL